LVDYDGDGDLDLVTGSDDCCDFDCEFFLFRRGGDGRFQTRESIRMQSGSGFDVTMRTRVCVADWDRDGHLDVLMQKNETRGLHLAPGPLAKRAEIGFSSLIAGSEPLRVLSTRPHVIDWDGDDVPDLLVGMTEPEGGAVYLLRGVDHPQGPSLAPPERLIAAPDEAHVTGLDVADWDGDGTSDLVVGLSWSERVAEERGKWRSQLWVYRRQARE
jgi:hypothetical protein